MATINISWNSMFQKLFLQKLYVTLIHRNKQKYDKTVCLGSAPYLFALQLYSLMTQYKILNSYYFQVFFGKLDCAACAHNHFLYFSCQYARTSVLILSNLWLTGDAVLKS